MPPKKAGKKGGGDDDDVDYTETLIKNYKAACRTMGLEYNEDLMNVMVPEDDGEDVISQLCFDKRLGPGGTRALVGGLLGRGTAMAPKVAFKHLKSLRLWSCAVQDAGAGALAQLLLVGPPRDLKLTLLEVMDNEVGPAGCRAIGDALMLGGNSSLMTLRLDLNRGIGDAGALELSHGLRTNRVLSKLTLSYCGMTAAGMDALADVVRQPTCAIEYLDVRGNRIGSEGLHTLATALARNTKLEQLEVADNGIGSSDPDTNKAALEALGEALSEAPDRCRLAKVDLRMNVLEEGDAAVLVPFLGPENKKVESFLVDASLSPALFDQLLRVGGGKKKKGKGKGKKKKKA